MAWAFRADGQGAVTATTPVPLRVRRRGALVAPTLDHQAATLAAAVVAGEVQDTLRGGCGDSVRVRVEQTWLGWPCALLVSNMETLDPEALAALPHGVQLARARPRDAAVRNDSMVHGSRVRLTLPTVVLTARVHAVEADAMRGVQAASAAALTVYRRTLAVQLGTTLLIMLAVLFVALSLERLTGGRLPVASMMGHVVRRWLVPVVQGALARTTGGLRQWLKRPMANDSAAVGSGGTASAPAHNPLLRPVGA